MSEDVFGEPHRKSQTFFGAEADAFGVYSRSIEASIKSPTRDGAIAGPGI